MIRALLTLIFGIGVAVAFGQTNGDYRSIADGNWNAVNTWQVYNGGWVNLGNVSAGPFRNIIPSQASGNISILNNVTVTANISINETTISAGARLIINVSRTVIVVDDFTETPLRIDLNGLLINNGTLNLTSQLSATPCVVDGFLASNATILTSNPSLLVFNNGSTYQHSNSSGGNIPFATWA